MVSAPGYDDLVLSTTAEDLGETTVVEAYGGRFALSAPDAATLQSIVDGLPRGWAVSSRDSPRDTIVPHFALLQGANGGYRIRDAHGFERLCADRELAIWMLRTQLRRAAALQARDSVCLQAGAVTYRGHGILLPGQAFAGTSTMVQALVRAGAEYQSDELTMIDSEGLIAQSGEATALSSAGVQARVPVGLVAFTVYQPGSAWTPRRLTPGEGIAALMAYATARDRPAETLATFRRTLQSATVLQGDRGEADEVAPALFGVVSALPV